MRDLWYRLRPQSASEADWRFLWKELEGRYVEPHRTYHNLIHIEEVTTLLVAQEQRIKDFFAVMMAAFFHDVVLVPGDGDNEKKSAALATERLIPFVTSEVCERVASLIRATEGHAANLLDADLCLLIDADLAILGASSARFSDYDLSIRAEYRHIPNFLYRHGRRKFFQRMTERASIFHDPHFKAQFEEQARKNIAAALEEDL